MVKALRKKDGCLTDDDTSLFSIVEEPVKSDAELNHYRTLITQWEFQWNMNVNPDPNKQA